MSILERSTKVLDVLAQHPGKSWTVGQLSEATNIPMASCCRLLQQLRDLDWVDQTGQRANYRLGPRAFSLSGGSPYRPDIVTAAQQPMVQLAEEWPDSGVVLLRLRDAGYEVGQEVLWVCGAYEESNLQAQTRNQAPWHGPGSRVLVAFLSSKERMRWINRVGLPNAETWPGIASRKELLHELALIRREGHAVKHQKKFHMSSVAVPIDLSCTQTRSQELVSLGMYFPYQNITDRRIDALQRAAHNFIQSFNHLQSDS